MSSERGSSFFTYLWGSGSVSTGFIARGEAGGNTVYTFLIDVFFWRGQFSDKTIKSVRFQKNRIWKSGQQVGWFTEGRLYLLADLA